MFGGAASNLKAGEAPKHQQHQPPQPSAIPMALHAQHQHVPPALMGMRVPGGPAATWTAAQHEEWLSAMAQPSRAAATATGVRRGEMPACMPPSVLPSSSLGREPPRFSHTHDKGGKQQVAQKETGKASGDSNRQAGQMGSGALSNAIEAWTSSGIFVSRSRAGRVDESVDVGAQANPSGVYPVMQPMAFLPRPHPPPGVPSHAIHGNSGSRKQQQQQQHGARVVAATNPSPQRAHALPAAFGPGMQHLPHEAARPVSAPAGSVFNPEGGAFKRRPPPSPGVGLRRTSTTGARGKAGSGVVRAGSSKAAMRAAARAAAAASVISAVADPRKTEARVAAAVAAAGRAGAAAAAGSKGLEAGTARQQPKAAGDKRERKDRRREDDDLADAQPRRPTTAPASSAAAVAATKYAHPHPLSFPHSSVGSYHMAPWSAGTAVPVPMPNPMPFPSEWADHWAHGQGRLDALRAPAPAPPQPPPHRSPEGEGKGLVLNAGTTVATPAAACAVASAAASAAEKAKPDTGPQTAQPARSSPVPKANSSLDYEDSYTDAWLAGMSWASSSPPDVGGLEVEVPEFPAPLDALRSDDRGTRDDEDDDEDVGNEGEAALFMDHHPAVNLLEVEARTDAVVHLAPQTPGAQTSAPHRPRDEDRLSAGGRAGTEGTTGESKHPAVCEGGTSTPVVITAGLDVETVDSHGGQQFWPQLTLTQHQAMPKMVGATPGVRGTADGDVGGIVSAVVRKLPPVADARSDSSSSSSSSSSSGGGAGGGNHTRRNRSPGSPTSSPSDSDSLDALEAPRPGAARRPDCTATAAAGREMSVAGPTAEEVDATRTGRRRSTGHVGIDNSVGGAGSTGPGILTKGAITASARRRAPETPTAAAIRAAAAAGLGAARGIALATTKTEAPPATGGEAPAGFASSGGRGNPTDCEGPLSNTDRPRGVGPPPSADVRVGARPRGSGGTSTKDDADTRKPESMWISSHPPEGAEGSEMSEASRDTRETEILRECTGEGAKAETGTEGGKGNATCEVDEARKSPTQFCTQQKRDGEMLSRGREEDPVRLGAGERSEGGGRDDDKGATVTRSGSAMIGFRLLAWALLAYSAFWVAAYRGLWYDSHVFARKSSAFEFQVGGFSVSGGKARVLVFFVAPILLAAVCGALGDAVEEARSQLRRRGGDGGTTPSGTRVSSSGGIGLSMRRESAAVKQPAPPSRLWTLLHFTVRPLGRHYPWITVGEALALLTYVLVLVTMVWQGTDFKLQAHLDSTMPCAEDPSLRCEDGSDNVATSSSLVILKNVAKYMGFVAAIQFSLVLVPVSRDSQIWSAIGVPFERAVLYHTAVGHLSFVSLFLHGALYMTYYVEKHGWGYAVNSAFHYEGHGVNVPAGLVAGLCAIPMWVLSLPFVRRQYYRLFKTSHFLFIGVFAGGLVHYDGFVYYLLAGFALYLMHAVSRLGNWNWVSVFKECLCKSGAPARGCGGCSLVNLHAGDEYARLVLRSPGGISSTSAKGGMFVYISAPALLGTVEAHPMSVALRGAPPCLWNTVVEEEGVFTLYVKTMGSWTRALRKQEGDNLTVHVDGFYRGSPSSSLAAMKTVKGFRRVVLFAGGSGVTSFTALIQDWCQALNEGEDVPEVHLVWSCRRVEEIELLGEALPTLLASAAPAGAESLLKISLFCSGKRPSEQAEGPLSVSWPIAKAPENMEALHGVKKSHAVYDSLNNAVRTFIAGGGAFAGWVWAENAAEGRVLQGVAVLSLMTVVPATLLALYGWLWRIAFGLWLHKKPFRVVRKRYIQLRDMGADQDRDDPEGAGGVRFSSNGENGPVAIKTFPVAASRAPVHELLMSELEIALREEIGRVKVLVSGPGGMVDDVMAETRKVSWKVFDVESASREF
eukprot:g1684.t1